MVLVKIDGWDLAILWESTAGNKFYALRCALTLARDERAKAAATATAPKEDAVAGIVMKALLALLVLCNNVYLNAITVATTAKSTARGFIHPCLQVQPLQSFSF